MIDGDNRAFRWPALPLAAFISAAVVSLVLALLYLLVSKAGLYGASMGVDWAHHMTVIDIMASGGRAANYPLQLWEFAGYPRLSYWPAVWLSRDFPVSTLQAYQIIAMFAAIIGLVMTAMIVVDGVGFRDRANLVGLIVAGTALYILSDLGFSHMGMTAYNGFYSQSVATAVALVAYGLLHLLAVNERLWALTLAVPVACGLTAAFHLTPALWLAAAGLMLVVSCRVLLFKTIIAAVLVTALTAALMYYAPGTLMTLRVAVDSNGAGTYNGRGITIGQDLGVLFFAYIALLLVSLSLAVLVWRRGSLKALQHEYLRQQAGGLGLLGLGSLLLANIIVSDPAGYYSLTKYASLFTLTFALAVGALAAEVARQVGSGLRSDFRFKHQFVGGFASALFVLIFSLSQGIELPWRSQDQSQLIAMQRTPRNEFPHWHTLTPALPSSQTFTAEEEYYIAVSILGYPRDLVRPILPDGGIDEMVYGPQVLHPARFTGAIELWSGQRLHVALPEFDRYLQVRLAERGLEDWGRWVAGRRIEFLGQVSPTFAGMGICMESVAAPVSEMPHTERLVVSFDAGGEPQTISFDANTRNATVFVPFADPMPTSGEFVLTIENVANSLGAVQRGSPEIGVGLVSMWVSQSDCE